MAKLMKMKKWFYAMLIIALVLSGAAVSVSGLGLVINTPEPAFSQPEPTCVCAECGYKCGSGHATTCSSYQKPKAKTPITDDLVAEDNNIVLAANCIEKDLQCTLNGTPCCSPYECKGKFPNTTCK